MFGKKKSNFDGLLHELRAIKESVENNSTHKAVDETKFDGSLADIAKELNDILALKDKKYDDMKLKFDLTIEAANIGLWDFEFENGYPKDPNIYSGKTREILGYTDENDFPNVYDSWAKTVHPDDNDYVGAEFFRHISDTTGGTPFQTEYRSQMKNGEYRWVKTNAITLFDENGNPLRNVGVFMSSHEQRIELEKVKNLLKRFELVNSALTLTPPSSEGVWGFEMDSDEKFNEDIYCWYSPQLIRILGYNNPNEFPSVTGTLTQHIHPEDYDKVMAEYDSLISQKKNSIDLSYRLKLKNGEYCWFNLLSEVNKDDSRGKIQVSGIIKDITEDRRKNEVEEEIVENMNQFSAAVSQLAEATSLVTREAQEVSDEYNRTAETANIVKESIDKTKNITDLIKRISEQINLLGLNASIEASRAGEHGKGFAVVADEVRNLAINSSNAVNEIDDMMSQVNQSVSTILTTIDNLKLKVNSQAATTEEINATTENIKDMSLELLNVVQKIR